MWAAYVGRRPTCRGGRRASRRPGNPARLNMPPPPPPRCIPAAPTLPQSCRARPAARRQSAPGCGGSLPAGRAGASRLVSGTLRMAPSTSRCSPSSDSCRLRRNADSSSRDMVGAGCCADGRWRCSSGEERMRDGASGSVVQALPIEQQAQSSRAGHASDSLQRCSPWASVSRHGGGGRQQSSRPWHSSAYLGSIGEAAVDRKSRPRCEWGAQGGRGAAEAERSNRLAQRAVAAGRGDPYRDAGQGRRGQDAQQQLCSP